MSQTRILVAYDGSPCAEAAIYDLQRAGLPNAVQAHVLSVADMWVLPQDDAQAPPPPLPSTTAREARESAAAMVERATLHAMQGKKLLMQLFPTWEVTSSVATNAPAWAITLEAEERKADLIVMGSHGYSAIGKLLLGSVSQSVLTHARCSVRVARTRPTLPDRPLRILVGVDGSGEAQLAAQMAASRAWPAGSDIRFVMVVNPNTLDEVVGNLEAAASPATASRDVAMPNTHVPDAEQTISQLLAHYVEMVERSGKGTTASVTYLSGDPKRAIVEFASNWGADSIFVGSRGKSQWERLLLGSVSAAVTSRASCSVEVWRAAAGQ